MARGRVDQSRLPVAQQSHSILTGALYLLDQHYSSWAKNTTIAPRLSKAILTANPGLNGAGARSAQPGSQEFSNAMGMLGMSHDRSMLAVLRPFLANKVVDGNGVLASQRTPLRVCEIAANAICTLLGEPRPYGGSASGLASFPPGPYALWDEWDKQEAELAKRLDALPTP